MKKLSRALAVAALASAAFVPMVSAPAYSFDLYDQKVGPCRTGVAGWGSNGEGVFPFMRIWDQGSIPNHYTLRIDRSRSVGELIGCRYGYRATGGQKKIVISWTVTGNAITSCNLGMNLGCDISYDNNVARDGYTAGFIANGNGFFDVDVSSGDVYTSKSNGEISSYNHTAQVYFKKDGVTINAGQSNIVYN